MYHSFHSKNPTTVVLKILHVYTVVEKEKKAKSSYISFII